MSAGALSSLDASAMDANTMNILTWLARSTPSFFKLLIVFFWLFTKICRGGLIGISLLLNTISFFFWWMVPASVSLFFWLRMTSSKKKEQKKKGGAAADGASYRHFRIFRTGKNSSGNVDLNCTFPIKIPPRISLFRHERKLQSIYIYIVGFIF